jgi:hypothetical protein
MAVILAKAILHQYSNPLAKANGNDKTLFPAKGRRIREFTLKAIPNSIAVGFSQRNKNGKMRALAQPSHHASTRDIF